MGSFLAVDEFEIVLRLGPIGHRPKHCIIVFGIDVVVDCDNPATSVTIPRRRSIKATPDLVLPRIASELDHEEGQYRGERLVHVDASHALHTDTLEMRKQLRLHCRAADRTRLTGCNLADNRSENRMSAMRDRGHVQEGVVFLQVPMAVRLAEWALRLECVGADE